MGEGRGRMRKKEDGRGGRTEEGEGETLGYRGGKEGEGGVRRRTEGGKRILEEEEKEDYREEERGAVKKMRTVFFHHLWDFIIKEMSLCTGYIYCYESKPSLHTRTSKHNNTVIYGHSI